MSASGLMWLFDAKHTLVPPNDVSHHCLQRKQANNLETCLEEQHTVFLIDTVYSSDYGVNIHTVPYVNIRPKALGIL